MPASRIDTGSTRARSDRALRAHVYLPVSRARRPRALRGVHARPADTALPSRGWSRRVSPPGPIRLVETAQAIRQRQPGRARVLAQRRGRASRRAARSSRSAPSMAAPTLNLAINAPAQRRVVTLDLPADQPTAFRASRRRSGALCREAALRRRVPAIVPPAWRGCRRPHHAALRGFRDLRLVAASAAAPGSCSSTDRTPMTMRIAGHRDRVAAGANQAAWCIWHDYGVWAGVTRALEEIEASRISACGISAARAWWSGGPAEMTALLDRAAATH